MALFITSLQLEVINATHAVIGMANERVAFRLVLLRPFFFFFEISRNDGV